MNKIHLLLLLVLVDVLSLASVAVGQTVSADRFYLNTGPCVERSGSGSPEGAVTGNVCDTYHRTDTPYDIYRKTSGSGNTGWVIDTAGLGAAQGEILYSPVTGTIDGLATSGTAGTFLRAAPPLPEWSALILPNSATIGDVMVGSAANTVAGLATGAAGTILRAGGAGAVPAWSTATYPATTTQGDLIYSAISNQVNTLAVSGTAGTFLRAAPPLPEWSALILPNSATANQVVYATALNTWGGGTGLTYDGSTLTVNAAISTPAATNLTLSPTGDLVTNPTGNDILPTTNYDINIGSPSLKYLSLEVGELRAATLVAQDVLATTGGRVMVVPTTLLTADLAPAGTTLTVKHNNLANGDRIFLQSAPAGVAQFEVMSVDSIAGGGAGAYTYTVTRNLDATGANQWYAGDAVANTGTTGDGYMDLYSTAGILGTGTGPSIVGNVRTGTTYNNIAARWALGNLNGLYGYAADTYGAAFGDSTATNVTIDATNGFRIRSSTTNKLVADTSGNLSLASYSVTLDSTGVHVTPAAAAWDETKSYAFTAATGGLGVGGVDGAGLRALLINAYWNGASTRESRITLNANGATGAHYSDLELGSTGADGGAWLELTIDSQPVLYALATSATGSQKIGIGTVSPAQMLDISSTAPSFQMSDTTASAKDLRLVTDANVASFYEAAGAAGDILSLDLANNRVGIGRTAPGEKLEVYGDATRIKQNFPTTTSYAQHIFAENGTMRSLIGAIGSGFATVARRDDFEIQSFYGDITMWTDSVGTPVQRLGINTTGGIFLSSGVGTGTGGNYLCIDTTSYEILRGNGAACTASSARFKQDIRPIGRGLRDVLALRPVSDEYRPETNMGVGRRLDLIAEEVAEVVPEVVTRDAQGEVFGIDYPMLVPVLIQAIQEQQQRIESLERRFQ